MFFLEKKLTTTSCLKLRLGQSSNLCLSPNSFFYNFFSSCFSTSSPFIFLVQVCLIKCVLAQHSILKFVREDIIFGRTIVKLSCILNIIKIHSFNYKQPLQMLKGPGLKSSGLHQRAASLTVTAKSS